MYSPLWEALTGQEAAPARAVQLLEKRFGESTAGAQRRRKFVEPLVLVLDELDYLVTRKQSVIYNLFEWATNATSGLIVVAISNTMDLPERVRRTPRPRR